MMIPNIKGGGTAALGGNDRAMSKVDSRFRENLRGQNHYWGDKITTAGPVYAGAIVMFFFVFGLFLLLYGLWLVFF